MLRFILNRLVQAIPVLLAIYAITFTMTRLAPGNPFSTERRVPQFIIERQMEYYGFNDPLPVQFGTLLWKHFTFDFPPLTSHVGMTAGDIISESFPVSLELALWSILIALLLGIPAGAIAAAKQNTWLDYLPMSLAMIGICIPTFVIGPLLALVFGIHLQWTSAGGWEYANDRVLPSLTLGFFYGAYIARLTRASMLEALSMDYIRTARAKGVSFFRIVSVHALRGGILPVVSYLGPTIAGLVTGSFVVETIFQVPGLGRHFVQAAINRDHSLILSTVLFYAVIIIVANLLVDIAQALLNPKLRYE